MKTFIHGTLDSVRKLPKGTEESESSGLLPAFQEALRSRHASDIHFELPHLYGNGNTVFIAGSETTASSMGAGAYHLLANPSILVRLQAELDEAWLKGTPSWTDLEQIPLLKGVVLETLRLDNGVSRRFPRVNWQSDTVLSDEVLIPRGYTMSMSHRFMFFNPKIFSDPQKFDPDRWTQSDEQTARLSKYLHPFQKGHRQCLAYRCALSIMTKLRHRG
jgi:cytochrome P450